MHYMIESAITSPVRARQRSRRFAIQEHACRLVIERGFTGFTMDDLAASVGISRRTLFNDVSDKASAVLGPQPEIEDFPAVAEFVGGGPGHELYPDLIATILAIAVATVEDDAGADQRHRLMDEAMNADIKVFQLVTERFQQMTEILADGICRREQWPSGDLRARALAASVLALIRLAMDEQKAEPDGWFGDRLRSVVAAEAAARDVRDHCART